MTIIRQYRLEVAQNASNSLRLALRNLVQALEHISGFEGAELSQNSNNELVFIFRERWSSAAEHSAGAKVLPKELFTALKGFFGCASYGRISHPYTSLASSRRTLRFG